MKLIEEDKLTLKRVSDMAIKILSFKKNYAFSIEDVLGKRKLDDYQMPIIYS